ncbi:MAG: hypothetical protein WEB00_00235 [Dehalococcoidia bacterium]
MKIEDILPQLTVLPLRRFADAWDVPTMKSDKRDVFEQAILSEIDRIDNEVAVAQRLQTMERELDYVRYGNAAGLLRLVVDLPGYVAAGESELIAHLIERDSSFLDYANAKGSTNHLDPRAVDIYQSILEVAWENKVSFEEYQLIKRLQKKLGINRRDHQVIEQRAVGRSSLSPQEAGEALRNLSYHGFVCQFRHRGQMQVIVPEEIALQLRAILGISLQSGAYRNLAAKLPISVIRKALEENGQPAVGLKKDYFVDRLIDGEVSPSTLLEGLEADALDALFASFPEQTVPKLRSVKIRHLISHFDRYASTAPAAVAEDPDRTYFTYLVELGARQYEVLHSANVIQRDQNVDRFFERGVRYVFRTIFGHPGLEFSGSAHADGGVAPKHRRMVLWDCKSAVSPYALTEARCAQFVHYIAKEQPNVVNPFLVFSGAFTEDSASRAVMLKASCPPGSEIGLMSAADLKWLAEKWTRDYPGKILPLDVLAHSGFLNREVLEFRLKAFANKAEEKEVQNVEV